MLSIIPRPQVEVIKQEPTDPVLVVTLECGQDVGSRMGTVGIFHYIFRDLARHNADHDPAVVLDESAVQGRVAEDGGCQ